ncbi:hypothetical protein DMENIID0001_036740 [Sergentomyia squamirostris]
MEFLDKKDKICMRCDLPKNGQKNDNNNVTTEVVNGEMGVNGEAAQALPERRVENGECSGGNETQAGNLLSEDEISSNSDDCVYTYRGGHMEPVRVLPEKIVDDTDFLEFLEMDFDPEPSSEQDNYPETSYFPELDGFIANLQENYPLTAAYNGLNLMEKSTISREENKVREVPEMDSDQKVPELAESNFSERIQRNTGAKPKVTQQIPPVKVKKSPTNPPAQPEFYHGESSRTAEVCLECSELKFLSETTQNPNKQTRRCSKHFHERSKSPVQSVNHLPWEPPTRQPPIREPRNLLDLNLDLSDLSQADKLIKLPTIDCREENIAESLASIGVKVNTLILGESLHQHINEEELREMDLTEFLLHIAKEKCDFRKIIDAIRAACEESAQNLHFTFEPSKDLPEMIKVSLSDIALRWDPNTSLRELMNVHNKYFQTFNVVGKIANAVRQLNTAEEMERSDHVLIPNYYKSGFVVISRRKC